MSSLKMSTVTSTGLSLCKARLNHMTTTLEMKSSRIFQEEMFLKEDGADLKVTDQVCVLSLS